VPPHRRNNKLMDADVAKEPGPTRFAGPMAAERSTGKCRRMPQKRTNGGAGRGSQRQRVNILPHHLNPHNAYSNPLQVEFARNLSPEAGQCKQRQQSSENAALRGAED
jgi:hypothetical protein